MLIVQIQSYSGGAINWTKIIMAATPRFLVYDSIFNLILCNIKSRPIAYFLPNGILLVMAEAQAAGQAKY
ncbi:hypothetical protein COT77_01580 [Candidatus Berkelbacteria bacterium CG10_big_fil_rev_8_21_14_0_10_41_12]|uniref:Uncharacterized protein n=1 Tax=Candidatus Berkelbacteria bacterium CG10_big_fil_rev_8_21_14_0_10_41_12 TaxID=1974513 RepID=A0A2M6WXG4_9BACT|nr:MAG: hypothetical protein COT77_01580 [Candidatus Berkelbacteria bacterium CG10_big_fil_rev_8_21_14_0_10_41_12]